MGIDVPTPGRLGARTYTVRDAAFTGPVSTAQCDDTSECVTRLLPTAEDATRAASRTGLLPLEVPLS